MTSTLGLVGGSNVTYLFRVVNLWQVMISVQTVTLKSHTADLLTDCSSHRRRTLKCKSFDTNVGEEERV
jgi:hypothetical protein